MSVKVSSVFSSHKVVSTTCNRVFLHNLTHTTSEEEINENLPNDQTVKFINI